MDWTSSGVRHRLECYIVDPRTLEEVEPLQGVTSFSLAESWRGDYRQTGSIDIDGARLPLWADVRVYLVSELGGETVRTELCTMTPKAAPVDTIHGREVVSYDLYSPLRRLGDNVQAEDVGVPENTRVSDHFAEVCDACGAASWMHFGFTGARTRAPRVWEAGDTYLSEAHAIASACGGRIEPDSHGRVCLVPYQNPARVGDSFEVPGGAASAVLPGLTEAAPEIVNKVVASYSQDDRKYYAAATVPPAHPWSFERIGRWAAYEVTPPQIPDGQPVQATLDALVAQTLAARSDPARVWSVEMLYMPVQVGQAGTVSYTDGAASLTLRGFVAERELQVQGASVRLSLTLEEVPSGDA